MKTMYRTSDVSVSIKAVAAKDHPKSVCFQYFDTWQEAYDFLKQRAVRRLEHAHKILKKAELDITTINTMAPQ